MIHSSLGFHTLTLSSYITYYELTQLEKDFILYWRKTKGIKIYVYKKDGSFIHYQPKHDALRLYYTKLKIEYTDYHGIQWIIREDTWHENFNIYIIEAIINPKFLSGITDYFTAATYKNMPSTINNFNMEAQKISPLLKSFDQYRITRIDYCINFSLSEYTDKCSAEKIMELIKRSNVPPHYEEWKIYDNTAHRMKSKPNSFYLYNNCVTINCYNKYEQLLEKSQKNIARGFSPIPQEMLTDSRNLIRFEVQCKYRKTYDLSKKAEESGNKNYNKYENLLTDEKCHSIINYYFDKVIGKGDWYSQQYAIDKIKRCSFNKQKETRLIDAVKLVNRCRSLAKAKSSYQGHDLDAFNQTLRDLSALNINPVTIPKEWGVKHIPNLLYTYNDKYHHWEFIN